LEKKINYNTNINNCRVSHGTQKEEYILNSPSRGNLEAKEPDGGGVDRTNKAYWAGFWGGEEQSYQNQTDESQTKTELEPKPIEIQSRTVPEPDQNWPENGSNGKESDEYKRGGIDDAAHAQSPHHNGFPPVRHNRT